MSNTSGLSAAFARANYAIYLAKLAQQGGGGGTWGSITGTLANQTDLNTALSGKQSTLTFSTGLTNTAGIVTSNFATGIAGGQSVIGGTASGNNLTLSSTSNGTKGKILFGGSSYFFDEANNLLSLNGSTINSSGVLKLGSAPVYMSPQNSATFGSQPTIAFWDVASATPAAGQSYGLGYTCVSIWGTGTQFDTEARLSGAFLDLKSTNIIRFYSGLVNSGSPDTGIARSAAGVLEINNGTAGTTRDLKVRNITIDTGGTSVTPSTADNTTAIATTAFVKAQAYAPLASPTFTGTPTLPTGTIATTQTAGNSSTAIATTAFVATSFAPLASPTFTGTPTLPTGTIATTQAAGNSSTAIATTAFVIAQTPGKSSRVADTAAINTTETQLATLTIASGLAAGTTYKLTAYGTCTSTVANASNFRVRIGTAGTAADTVHAVVTPTSAASGTSVPFYVEFHVTIRTTGAGGTTAGNGRLENNGVTGVSAATLVVGTPSTGTAVNTTVSNFLTLWYVSAATTTTSTFQLTTIELVKQ